MLYYLMNKNNIVAEFETIDSMGINTYKMNKQYGKLPYGFNNLLAWINSRHLGIFRDVGGILKTCIGSNKTDLIEFTHCTSINDTFWLMSKNKIFNWSDVSLYQNEFDEQIAKAVFTETPIKDLQNTRVTPEFSLNGNYGKCCMREQDKLFIYKNGKSRETEHCAKIKVCNEILSSQLYSKITNNSVEYSLDSLYGILASKCEVFTNENIGFVPYKNIINNDSLESCLNFYVRHNSEDSFRAMILADAVCFNTDRNYENHGVLMNNNTLDIIGMSPIFDMESSLNNSMTISADNIKEYKLRHNTGLGNDLIKIAKQVITEELRETLLNLRGYRFEFNHIEKYINDREFTKKRLEMLTKMVNQQIDKILGKGKIVGCTGIFN